MAEAPDVVFPDEERRDAEPDGVLPDEAHRVEAQDEELQDGVQVVVLRGSEPDEALPDEEPVFRDEGQDEGRRDGVHWDAEPGEVLRDEAHQEAAVAALLLRCEAVTVSRNLRQSDLPGNREMYVYPYSLTSLIIKAGRIVF